MAKPIVHAWNFKDLTGKRFGRLVVLEFAGYYREKWSTWNCVCDCGNRVVVRGMYLNSGATKSCGCLANELTSKRHKTHGKSGTPFYLLYRNVWSRCYNPRNKVYADYGGRGIQMCERWLGPKGFENFLADMGQRPTPQHTIERNDNDGPYSPENCRWATRKEQARNKRNNRTLTFNGETLTTSGWSDKTGLPAKTIYYRAFVRKWSVSDALTRPLKTRG